jgi:hypothetical protein
VQKATAAIDTFRFACRAGQVVIAIRMLRSQQHPDSTTGVFDAPREWMGD